MKKICYLDKTRQIYKHTLHFVFCSKVFTPWLVKPDFPSGESVSVSSVIVVNESLSCSQCEKFDLKTMQSMLGRVQIHTNAATKECMALEGFF